MATEVGGPQTSVMVWIPGGGFETGSASIFDGSALAAYEDVLVVTIQYRLGIFGFFTTRDQHAPGNWAFQDQLAALLWVKENIKFFGGNPDSVTLFGGSAGAISISSLILSPLSTGLFHRAIMESGVAIIPNLKGLDDERRNDLQVVADVCGCSVLDSQAMLKCLREKSSLELLSLGKKTKSFTRVVDGSFFPDEPLELLSQKAFKAVPSIIGVNNQECGYILPMRDTPEILLGSNKSVALNLIHVFLHIPTQYLHVVAKEYLHDKHSLTDIRDALLDLLGDVFFVVPGLVTARYHRDAGAPVYFYEFQHRPQCFENTRPAFVKADHTDEVRFVFGGPFLKGDIAMFAGHASSPPVVDTVHGKVLGKYASLEGFEQPVAVFLGVPFAKPPLGSLRFAPPQPAEPWSFVKDATSYPPMCSQDATVGKMLSDLFTNRKENIPLQFSEDCLYLNIYTPANLTKSMRLPVMVWIHGGSLVVGGASTYDGLALSAHENVVVVTIQYRLGIWGFFSTGDEHSRGNWGHLDQLAALRWVQDNIVNFGGDPDSVTIFGESAGGESVSVLVLSPLAKNLFHRAISESGVALTPGMVRKDVKPVAEQVAIAAGCKTTTSAAMVNCLRQKTEDELMEINLKLKPFKVNLLGDLRESCPFLPTAVDGVFLPKTPEEILAEKNFSTVPYMVGINKQEFDAGAPVYMYEFQYRPSFSSDLKPEMVTGDHGDELFSVFGAPFTKGGASSEEINVSKMVMKFWGNFAWNGNPNEKTLSAWPEYDQNEGYLKIGATTQAAQGLKDKEVAFWTKVWTKEAVEKLLQEKN
ncbi:hypothetical protein ACRRTK_009385 [Alexandromys fortis]